MNNLNFSQLNDNLQRFVHYIWDPEPRNTEPNKPIYLLGVAYPPNQPPTSPSPYPSTPSPPASTSAINILPTDVPPASTFDSTWPPDFLLDLSSRIWITYRHDFPAIPRSPTTPTTLLTKLRTSQSTDGFTSDEGWGCMIRSAQCVLANTLSILQHSRTWRRTSPQDPLPILKLFADTPAAPFSVHNFVAHGQKHCGVEPGEWFGPSAAARCIAGLAEHPAAGGLRVHISDADTVYTPQFLRTAYAGTETFHPTLLLIPIRLGIKGVTQVYWEALKASVTMTQSVGIAGGRPSSSHYFLGVQGDRFIYMDPHVCRPALTEEGLDVESCYSRRLRMLRVQDMDPSMMMAFLIRDEEEWRGWRRGVREVVGKAVVNVVDVEAGGEGREGAVDEVESFTDDEEGLM